jgi:glycosyltransferase involved in cell wall biosynthesis
MQEPVPASTAAAAPPSTRRILQLVPVCGDSVAQVAREYARQLAPEGCETHIVHLFCRRCDDHLPIGAAASLRYLDLPGREPLGLRLRALRQLRTLLREHPWDLVICHRHKAAELVAQLGLFAKLPPCCYVVHGVRPLSGFVRAVRRLRARVLFRPRFRYLAVSEFVASRLRASGLVDPRESVETVPNTLDVTALRASQQPRDAARAALGLPADAFLFGSLGRLITTKNIPLLLHAFARIAPSCPDAQLVLIGGGKLGPTLQAQAAALGIAERVHFTGQIPAAARLLRALDVFVFASTAESFGLAVAEAMVAEVPVIAVDAGGVPEVLGGQGTLVANDEAALAAAMLASYRQTAAERAALGAAAAADATARLSTSRLPQLLPGLLVGDRPR